jgi:hypothetical protein
MPYTPEMHSYGSMPQRAQEFLKAIKPFARPAPEPTATHIVEAVSSSAVRRKLRIFVRRFYSYSRSRP